MKKFTVLLSTAALLLSLATAGFAADTIKLGVAGPHSGDLAPYGIPSMKAAQLVVKKINAAGGVLGKQVELLIQDDQCKPEMATNAATKLVTDGAHVVLGHICSGATKAALGIYNDAKVPVMSPSATNPALTQSGDYPNFFRTIASDDMQARMAVDFTINDLGMKKVAVLHDKGDYGKGFAEFAKKFLEESGKAEVVLFEGVTPGAMDYSSIIQKVRREKAEALIWGGYHPEASKIVAQMKRKRMKAAFVSDDGVKDDSFLKVAGKSAEGAYMTGPRDLSGNALNKAANDEFKAEYGADPGAFFQEGYSAALALLNAIEKAGTTDYDKVVAALRTEYVETPVGKIKFDARGDAEGVGFSVYTVENGAFKELK
ncbi:branched-chain amino acid transport system substrate-binding protein [Malonomonas rubra DSM 5091]|uniref:Branched-chain amino acid transport system substrate-binding protein n=1 Tax=Malonomonas rubra DSM 5091 TaxID=1122189 RepID=A0A1M6C510_MALRU|nr:branched-chain amino acid ABC transporter substrate-binding protein [Malonomonas rubra]SHI55814.1 branched-chain amino acid transport system substrate-binding protein [Malonomonas rubra DSM 5091]